LLIHGVGSSSSSWYANFGDQRVAAAVVIIVAALFNNAALLLRLVLLSLQSLGLF
jgi:hypothetical protein